MDQQQHEQQRAGRFPNNDVLDHQLQQDSDTTGTTSASSNNSNNGSASGSSSSAVVVEDEPPSDFYASLCGLSGSQRKRKRTLLAAAPKGPDRSESSGRSSASAAVACMGTDRSVCIPPDEVTDETTSGGRSDMARALHKAFTDPPRLSSISLDKRNRGHAMLRRMGWSEDGGGLGKNRQGGMAPVKTELKLDRKGLGASAGRKKTKARVTHKHEHITAAATAAAGGSAVSAVQGSDGNACSESKSERKRRLKAEKERAARKDKRVRMMLSYDVPPEHEELYMKLH